ncbi:hypothetical protein FWK35_00009250 [Aphis craccivora]|uniref:Uncharacterized protein n=1 Tax=Aphis craccivora TaxID=307492 RepID=A0A6G0ZPC2_APHCR|nr:hypothetical protein FWK35_00009250 [Aphis craccivora]
MLCVFFCLCTRERVEIILQFQTMGGGYRWQNESSWCIGKVIF